MGFGGKRRIAMQSEVFRLYSDGASRRNIKSPAVSRNNGDI